MDCGDVLAVGPVVFVLCLAYSTEHCVGVVEVLSGFEAGSSCIAQAGLNWSCFSLGAGMTCELQHHVVLELLTCSVALSPTCTSYLLSQG